MSHFLFLVEACKSAGGWESKGFRSVAEKIARTGWPWQTDPATITLDGKDLEGCVLHDGVSSERLFLPKDRDRADSAGGKLLASLQRDGSAETFFSLRWVTGAASGFVGESGSAREVDATDVDPLDKELRAGNLLYLKKTRKFQARWIKASPKGCAGL